MVRRRLSLLAGLGVLLVPAQAAATPDCADLLPPRETAPGLRALVPEDLVRLRDMGPVAYLGEETRIPGRPAGTRAAFQLRRADPRTNRHCQAMVVIDLDRGAPPLVVDAGGELIRPGFDFRGKAAFPSGLPARIVPRWSPDGRWIAFLKRTDGVTQVWRAFADGSGSAPLTASRDDVGDFRISPDGGAILFTTRPGLARARRQIEAEGLRGFHYDDRYAPMSGTRPFPPMPIAAEVFVLDLAGGTVRPGNVEEAAAFASPGEAVSTPEALLSRWLAPGAARPRIAAIELPQRLFAREGQVVATLEDGSRLACAEPACADAGQIWWRNDGAAIHYLRREGWAKASLALYEWIPGGGPPRRLLLIDDILAGCRASGLAILCVREGSSQPRRIERLDPASGRRETVFDPNPEWARLRLGRVERLHVTNPAGAPSIADLVWPVGHRSGTRVPLLIVQYDTRGFLRGGTGDEYPIQAFANRGYAVLSFSRPASLGLAGNPADATEVGRINLAGFADRRSIHSSLEAAIAMAVARGVADPQRIGITGMSDGASTATFGLINSNLFAAAAMSNCCIDTSLPTRVGPLAARHFHGQGYPRLTDRDARSDEFWRTISLSRNARRIRTPILLQVSDDELMSALESYTALREVNAPIDMFVFPDEHHNKWQPTHRLSIYRRALDWFDYWLLGRRSAAPDRQTELDHWDRLRREVQAAPR